MDESLERGENCLSVPVSSMFVVQNHRWLHARDKFISHLELDPELLRQHGCFTQAGQA
jgi:protein CsiD